MNSSVREHGSTNDVQKSHHGLIEKRDRSQLGKEAFCALKLAGEACRRYVSFPLHVRRSNGNQMGMVAVVCGLVDWVRLQLAFDARAINASPVRYLSV